MSVTKLITALVTVIALAALSLSVPATAEALPPLGKDKAYKKLESYVNDLRSKRNKAATKSQKKQYRNKLNSLAGKATKSVKERGKQRLEEVKAKNHKARDAEIAKLEKEFQQIVDDIKDYYANEVAIIREECASDRARVKSAKKGAIKSTKKALNAAKQNGNGSKVKQLKKKLKKQKKALKKALAREKAKCQKKINQMLEERNEEIAAERDYIDEEIAIIKEAYAEELKAAKNDARQKNNQELKKVEDLKKQGNDYISKMPSK